MRIRNWRKFQTHHDGRKTPWIKLHYELLQSRDWLLWDDASKLLAVVCLLVASQRGGDVPDDAEYLGKLAFLSEVPSFKPLIASGFLEPTESYEKLQEASRSISTSTSTSRKGSVRENHYAFESGVIRLDQKNLDQWKRIYSHLDVEAELLQLTEWASQQPKWFPAVSGALAKRNRDVGVRIQQGKSNYRSMTGIEGVI